MVALAAINGVVATALGKRRLERAIESDFGRAPQLLAERFARTYDQFKAETGTWAEDKRYASWLGVASTSDSPTGSVGADVLKKAHDGLGGIVFTSWRDFRVTNDAGALLLDMSRQDAVGDNLARDAAVRRALAGEDVLTLRGSLLEMARAVTVEGAVRGVLIAGDPLEPVRSDVAEMLRATVRIDDGTVADGAVHTTLRGGDTWLETAVPIRGLRGEVIGRAVLERSLSAELAPQQRELLRALAIATAIGLAVALLLSMMFSRTLAAPVAELASATREIGQGHYDHRVNIQSSDELGTLGRAFNDMAAGLKQRVFFESALRRYLAAPVVEQLIQDPSRLRLGGEKREVTILFFDVAGFTTLAEELAADELVTLVNQYLDALVGAIFKHNGTFDKFIGDAVMAFWGAPLDQTDHAARACRAAVDMQTALRRFADGHADGRVRALTGRIGLHTGVAVLGNMGSTHVMNYTALGDTVNVAARLEGINKLYRTAIVASEATIAAAKLPRARELDLVRVKGRQEPVRIFELFGDGDAPPPDAIVAYGEGLAHYRARRFADAQKAFKRARTRGDGACADVMADRCNQLFANAPPADWDGAHNLTTK